ncbi:helix-turn-helix transcriptional regulator [Stenotrophomonas sp.]|uniref:helix-turn-helix domain-containing protein n=1 Tax=Stenotrophomonas sp. TaxID=69392 RepID=UPI0029ABF908|nr:helix-turn-helix transcriptional regulator [Stenotrophomonas sp.]MDX3934350.1 helix-turn-helix transcriptional regulator [Stenotrophomonas sp.]
MNAPNARSAREIFASRVKQVRGNLGISQRALGVAMGLPEDVAGVRINRYERAVHSCDTDTAQRMAKALGVSLAYLYAETEQLAELIQEFGQMTAKEQEELLRMVKAHTKKF